MVDSLTLKIYSMYRELKLGTNSHCTNCKEGLSNHGKSFVAGPLPIFHIGDEYEKESKKLVFYGSVAYGWEEASEIMNQWIKDDEKVSPDSIYNMMEDRVAELFFNKKGENFRYWSYMRKTCDMLFGDELSGYKKVAISNIMRCNTGSIQYDLPSVVRYNCANVNGNLFITKRELEILSPTHVVALTKTDGGYISQYNGPWKLKIMPHPSSRSSYSANSYAEEIYNWFVR